MTPETNVLVVAALDGLVTKLDQVLDELEGLPDTSTEKAEKLIFNITMSLYSLIDKLTEDGYEKAGNDE